MGPARTVANSVQTLEMPGHPGLAPDPQRDYVYGQGERPAWMPGAEPAKPIECAPGLDDLGSDAVAFAAQPSPTVSAAVERSVCVTGLGNMHNHWSTFGELSTSLAAAAVRAVNVAGADAISPVQSEYPPPGASIPELSLCDIGHGCQDNFYKPGGEVNLSSIFGDQTGITKSSEQSWHR
jgi:hypothetical protein